MKKYLIFYALLLSFVIHLSMGGALTFSHRPALFKPQSEVEITVIENSSDDRKALNQIQQIVEQDKNRLNDIEDPNAKYLGRHSQRVVKETKAANNGAFRNLNARVAGQPNPLSATLSGEAKTAQHTAGPTLRDLLPANDSSAFAVATHKATDTTNSPTPAAGADVSQNSDHLKNVDKGLETLLNTREFVFYSYYERIRGRLRQYWEPSIRHKVMRILRSGRRLASNRDHVTRIVITLDSAGDLVRVQVLEESGVRDLDDAAVEAFRSAAPFPNPPKGIVGADGTIQIRWDFVLES